MLAKNTQVDDFHSPSLVSGKLCLQRLSPLPYGLDVLLNCEQLHDKQTHTHTQIVSTEQENRTFKV